MRQGKSHLSSFNSQQTERSNQCLIYEQEKINSSYSNDKLFLKNIVKKVKKDPKNLAEHSINPFSDEQRNSVNSIPTISPLSSEQPSKIIE